MEDRNKHNTRKRGGRAATEYFHPLSLQKLNPNRLQQKVNAILAGDLTLVIESRQLEDRNL